MNIGGIDKIQKDHKRFWVFSFNILMFCSFQKKVLHSYQVGACYFGIIAFPVMAGIFMHINALAEGGILVLLNP